MTTIITEELIELALTAGACIEGIEEAKEFIGQPFSALPIPYRTWAAKYVAFSTPDHWESVLSDLEWEVRAAVMNKPNFPKALLTK